MSRLTTGIKDTAKGLNTMTTPNIPGVNSPSTPTPGVSSRASLVTYYSGILQKLPGKYTGTDVQYDGLTWSALYRKLAAANPTQDPKALADTVLGVANLQGVVTNAIEPAVDSTSTIGTAISKGAQSFANSVPNPLSGLDAIGAFFGGLTSANLWIRVLKGTIGATS